MPPKQSGLHTQKTRLWVWLVATVCAILAIAVIIAGLVVFVGYMILHPKLPYIHATYAHLDQFRLDQYGNLGMQMALYITAVNDNKKVHATFSDLKLTLNFDGATIVNLVAPSFDVLKNNTLTLPYSFESSIQLQEKGMEEADASLKRNKISFALKGDARTRWKVGIIGFVKFWTHLYCQMDFSNNGTRIDTSHCSSKTS